MIRQLIWDVDGTLLDTYPAFATAVALALGEIDVTVSPDRILSLCKRSLNHCVVTLADEFQADADDILAGFQRHYAAIPAQEQPPFPGVIEICGYIRSIGGSNLIVTHRGGRSLEMLLTAHRMGGYFADRLTADDGYPRKPDPSSFEAMISRQHLKREDVLAIGDRDIDVLAGHAAGVRTCLFRTAPVEVAPDYSITDYAELYRLLIAENRQAVAVSDG
jgi:phosphoglycolate phosphatase-like HAD superfamily hydrolase